MFYAGNHQVSQMAVLETKQDTPITLIPYLDFERGTKKSSWHSLKICMDTKLLIHHCNNERIARSITDDCVGYKQHP